MEVPMFVNRRIARELLDEACDGRSEVTFRDMLRALRQKRWLGFGLLDDEVYEDILVLAARNFWYPYDLACQLTWPEYIIAIALFRGHSSSRRDMPNEVLYMFQSMAMVPGGFRGEDPCYFTWRGWYDLE